MDLESRRWARARLAIDRLRGSLWTVPVACLIVAVGVSVAAVEVDQAVKRDGSGFAFTGGPQSARDILGAIASSMLTLAGLVFSITIVTLQLTSSQFSPRALRNFLRDRTSQLALGTFLATFAYSLAVLREVRGEDGVVGEFVPGFAVTLAFALVAFSLIMFIRYIHHIAQSIRAVNIIGRIAEETLEAVERVYPQAPPPPPAPALPARTGQPVASSQSGVIQAVDHRSLVRLAERQDLLIWMEHSVGEFVPAGVPLLSVSQGSDVSAHANPNGSTLGEELESQLRRHVILGRERTMRSDPAFGLRQLVDIAERALSPGVNDPTTSVQCIDQIHDILRRIATRPDPPSAFFGEGGTVRLVAPAPCWEDIVHLAFDEVRHWGANSIQVPRRLRQAIEDLITVAPPDRRAALDDQRRLLLARLDQLPPTERPLVGHANP